MDVKMELVHCGQRYRDSLLSRFCSDAISKFQTFALPYRGSLTCGLRNWPRNMIRYSDKSDALMSIVKLPLWFKSFPVSDKC